ncbi:MAG TPA: extracellular solute-binding protein [Nitrososphaeraceae archaeon]|jgi:multiple sugar transport system substrate-binding protein
MTDSKMKDKDHCLIVVALVIVLLSVACIEYTTNRPSKTIGLPIAYAQEKNVTMTALFDNLANPGRWDGLIQPALKILNERHPELHLNVSIIETPYDKTRLNILNALTNGSSIDLISVDQIWLGEFAEKGLLTDLTNMTKKWDRSSDWYQANWDGGSHNKKIYGVWAWTDVRGIWYWKDLLHDAGVDPNSLSTWNGYIAAAETLNDKLRKNGTDGMYLVAASHSPDLWYPYLWMLGGQILEYKDGHPTRGSYWFPVFNSSQGIRALEFLKEQVSAGIKPQANALHQAQDFVNKKFAVSIDGSWVPGEFPLQQRQQLEKEVGFLPMFPISSNETNQTATMMGGWEFGIPTTTKHKDLAWELVSLMVDPKILTPWLLKYGYLPTQNTIGEEVITNNNSSNIPYYEEMVKMIPFGHVRPSIAEYPEIAQSIYEAISSVLIEGMDPKQALQIAASKSAESLGWTRPS